MRLRLLPMLNFILFDKYPLSPMQFMNGSPVFKHEVHRILILTDRQLILKVQWKEESDQNNNWNYIIKLYYTYNINYIYYSIYMYIVYI